MSNPSKIFYFSTNYKRRLTQGPHVKANILLLTTGILALSFFYKLGMNPSEDQIRESRYHKHKQAVKEGTDPYKIYRISAMAEKKH